MDDVAGLLAQADREVGARWLGLEAWLRARFGRDASLESTLFLIGVQWRGIGYAPQLDRDDKQDLLMAGSYVCLHALGLCDDPSPEQADGDWSLRRPLPELSPGDRESLLKLGALRYFEQFMDSP